MKLRSLRSLLFVSVILAGCASHPKATDGTGPSGWWKPGTTDPQEIVQAMARCRVEASKASAGIGTVKNVFAAAAVDKHHRAGVTYDCLIGAGYRYTRQSAVPAGLAFVPEE